EEAPPRREDAARARAGHEPRAARPARPHARPYARPPRLGRGGERRTLVEQRPEGLRLEQAALPRRAAGQLQLLEDRARLRPPPASPRAHSSLSQRRSSS